MIKEERFKLVKNEKPAWKQDYRNTWVIESYGSGPCGSWYKHEKVWYHEDPLDDVDIALISYFTTGAMYHETADKFYGDLQWNKYNERITNKDIYEGPLAFILPYLYDDDYGMGIIDRNWDYIQKITIYKYDENGDKWEYPVKRIYEYFNTIDDLIKYVKEQMLIIRPKREEDEGIMVDPWEIDEAREVLAKNGWNEQELRYLRWIGNDRGFGACIKAHQWLADYIDKIWVDDSDKTKKVKGYIFDIMRYANKHCNELGWNGPSGSCGTYIYRVTENTDPELIEELEESDPNNIVRMDDGRVYILHEGD